MGTSIPVMAEACGSGTRCSGSAAAVVSFPACSSRRPSGRWPVLDSCWYRQPTSSSMLATEWDWRGVCACRRRGKRHRL